MDVHALAEAATHVLNCLFTGALTGTGERAANELYSLVARRLRTDQNADLLVDFEDTPDSVETRTALLSVLGRQLSTDPVFREHVEVVVSRALVAAPGAGVTVQAVTADRRAMAAGRDITQSKTNYGGIVVAFVAVAAIALVLFLVGRTVVNVVGTVASAGLDGASTCRDYLASSDMPAKAEVMKKLYLEHGRAEQAADPFIVQNTEYFCGSRPEATLEQLAAR